MESRVNKYSDGLNSDSSLSRTKRNQDLYSKINLEDIENVEIRENSSVLTTDARDININQVKDMLDKKYRDDYEKKTLKVESDTEYNDIEYEKTREYDINQILNEAKGNNVSTNYSEERLKTLRDTQYNILKNLDMQKKDVLEPSDSMGLMELINTITEKELTHTEVDPLDILSDLKGNDDTKIINTDSIHSELVEKSVSNDTEEFTDSIEFKNNDFDDFKDVSGGNNNVVTFIILGMLFIAFAFGIVILLNYLLNWGLF